MNIFIKNPKISPTVRCTTALIHYFNGQDRPIKMETSSICFTKDTDKNRTHSTFPLLSNGVHCNFRAFSLSSSCSHSFAVDFCTSLLYFLPVFEIESQPSEIDLSSSILSSRYPFFFFPEKKAV